MKLVHKFNFDHPGKLLYIDSAVCLLLVALIHTLYRPKSFGDFSIDAFDTEQMLECICKLKSGQSVHLPIYDFKQHRRRSDSFRQVISF